MEDVDVVVRSNDFLISSSTVTRSQPPVRFWGPRIPVQEDRTNSRIPKPDKTGSRPRPTTIRWSPSWTRVQPNRKEERAPTPERKVIKARNKKCISIWTVHRIIFQMIWLSLKKSLMPPETNKKTTRERSPRRRNSKGARTWRRMRRSQMATTPMVPTAEEAIQLLHRSTQTRQTQTMADDPRCEMSFISLMILLLCELI